MEVKGEFGGEKLGTKATQYPEMQFIISQIQFGQKWKKRIAQPRKCKQRD